MSNGMIEGIKKQLDDGRLSGEQASLYTLEVLLDLYERSEKQDILMNSFEKKLDKEIDRRREYEKYYPSLFWLAANNTRLFILIMLVFILIFITVHELVEITGVMQSILAMLGL